MDLSGISLFHELQQADIARTGSLSEIFAHFVKNQP